MNGLYSAISASERNMALTYKIIFLFFVATANAGILLVSPRILEGPSSKTILVGPDGSQISAIIPGGKILLDSNHGPLLQGAPEVVATASVAQPLPAVEVPVIAETKTDVETESVNTESASAAVKTAPEILVDSEVSSNSTESKTEENNEIESTTAVDTGLVTDAPVTEINNTSEEAVAVVETNSANSTSNVAVSEAPSNIVPSSKSLSLQAVEHPVVFPLVRTPLLPLATFEGQYIPDHSENLYDNGLYKQGLSEW